MVELEGWIFVVWGVLFDLVVVVGDTVRCFLTNRYVVVVEGVGDVFGVC